MKETTKKYLLDLVKLTIATELGLQYKTKIICEDPILGEECGAFVTLHKAKMLRGCIGYIVGFQPLENTIVEMAKAAAFRDPRFLPVTKDEFAELNFEISVLTPLEKLHDISLLEVGKHGLLLRRLDEQGVLLPQVAIEYNWNEIEFLEETCVKAGLNRNSWRDKETEIFIFSAEVFSDKKMS